jgi:hypothetical protein
LYRTDKFRLYKVKNVRGKNNGLASGKSALKREVKCEKKQWRNTGEMKESGDEEKILNDGKIPSGLMFLQRMI